MEPNRNVRQAVRYAIAAMAAATTPTILHAQDQEGAAAELTEVVVTGSRLRVETNDQSISPVSSVTTADIAATGLTRIEDVLNSLPQVFAAQGATVSNGSNGTATVNLRNLARGKLKTQKCLPRTNHLLPLFPNVFTQNPITTCKTKNPERVHQSR